LAPAVRMNFAWPGFVFICGSLKAENAKFPAEK
jgi:hypothetical protein